MLPSTDWKRSAYKEKERQRWYAGETISVAVGQGYNSFTLLQLAQGTSTLANDGLYRRPHWCTRCAIRARAKPTDSVPDYRIP